MNTTRFHLCDNRPNCLGQDYQSFVIIGAQVKARAQNLYGNVLRIKLVRNNLISRLLELKSLIESWIEVIWSRSAKISSSKWFRSLLDNDIEIKSFLHRKSSRLRRCFQKNPSGSLSDWLKVASWYYQFENPSYIL